MNGLNDSELLSSTNAITRKQVPQLKTDNIELEQYGSIDTVLSQIEILDQEGGIITNFKSYNHSV